MSTSGFVMSWFCNVIILNIGSKWITESKKEHCANIFAETFRGSYTESLSRVMKNC